MVIYKTYDVPVQNRSALISRVLKNAKRANIFMRKRNKTRYKNIKSYYLDRAMKCIDLVLMDVKKIS